MDQKYNAGELLGSRPNAIPQALTIARIARERAELALLHGRENGAWVTLIEAVSKRDIATAIDATDTLHTLALQLSRQGGELLVCSIEAMAITPPDSDEYAQEQRALLEQVFQATQAALEDLPAMLRAVQHRHENTQAQLEALQVSWLALRARCMAVQIPNPSTEGA